MTVISRTRAWCDGCGQIDPFAWSELTKRQHVAYLVKDAGWEKTDDGIFCPKCKAKRGAA